MTGGEKECLNLFIVIRQHYIDFSFIPKMTMNLSALATETSSALKSTVKHVGIFGLSY